MAHPRNLTVTGISVVGLGKLGLCLAAVLADSGFRVRGVDVSRETVDSVNKSEPIIFEPGLRELLQSVRARLSASSEFDDAVMNSEVTFVVVPTPSDEKGNFSVSYVKQAMREIGGSLAKKAGYHLVVLTSTVMPGAMDSEIRPELEAASGKRCGEEFGLCYNPEFIALGDVLRGLREPDFVLIGESDSKAGSLLAQVQMKTCSNSPPMRRMNFINAEISKIAVNSFVTMKISFANTLAELAERQDGGDVDVITSAVGSDKRIGLSYLRGALGYGGPCFPRDNVAFANFARRVGVEADLAVATHKVNLRQAIRIVQVLKRNGVDAPARVGILGLAYKPNTNVVEASQSLMVAQRLSETGFDIHVFDPAAMNNARPILGERTTFEKSAAECVAKTDISLLGTPWPEFRHLSPSLFENKIIIDCWGFFGGEIADRARKYVAIGKGFHEDRLQASAQGSILQE